MGEQKTLPVHEPDSEPVVTPSVQPAPVVELTEQSLLGVRLGDTLAGAGTPPSNVDVLGRPGLSHPTSVSRRTTLARSLQRRRGNAFVQRAILQRTVSNQVGQHFAQAKLRISQPGDKYEQEADRTADQMLRMPDPPVQDESRPGVVITQINEGNVVSTPKLSPTQETTVNTFRRRGQPLSESEREFFEPRFGRDFSQVRVYTGSQGAEIAQTLGTRAFTVGRDMAFGEGEYAPGTTHGKRLLAHELTHVVQQEAANSELLQRNDPNETPAQRISRVIADEDDDAIEVLTDEELAVSTPSQRAGMIRILTDLTWTSESKEHATLRLLRYRGQAQQVVFYLDALGYRQKVVDSVDDEVLHQELLELISGMPEAQIIGGDPITDALASRESEDVMAISDFSRATSAQRLGLLQIMLDMSWSNAPEESKILDIVESSGSGLSSLMANIKALGLKQSLFDHIDDEANQERLTELLGSLNDPELNRDLEVLNRGFWGNVWEGLTGGIASAIEEFSLRRIIMGLLHPIIHPIDTIVGLIDQFIGILENPSWDRLLTFGRDVFGILAIWFALLAMIASGVAGLVALGIITLPASIPIGIIAAGLWTITTVFFILFIAFAALKFLVDLIQAGTATTARELEREQQQIGEDITLLVVIAVLYGIIKVIGKIVRWFRRSAVEPEAAETEALEETATETESGVEQARDSANELQNTASEAELQARSEAEPQVETRAEAETRPSEGETGPEPSIAGRRPILGGETTDFVELYRYTDTTGTQRATSWWTDGLPTSSVSVASRITGTFEYLIKFRLTIRVNRAVFDKYFLTGNTRWTARPPATEYQSLQSIGSDYFEAVPMTEP
jgi:hypothetical protein